MQNFVFYLGIQFSDEEKRKCLNTAKRMIGLVDVVRSVGILGLEDEVENDTAFMKMGVSLMVNGLPAYYVEKILQNAILSGEYPETHLLDKLIIMQGLKAIVNRHSPFIIAHSVGSMLGEDYLPELIAETTITTNLNMLIDTYTIPLPESANFEKKLLGLTKTQLSYLLKPIAPGEHISSSMAFRGCSKSFINEMRVGLSAYSFSYICKFFSFLREIKEEILEHIKYDTLSSQNAILQYLKQLENSSFWETLT